MIKNGKNVNGKEKRSKKRSQQLIIMKRTGPTKTSTRELIVKLDKHRKASNENAYGVLTALMGVSTRERAEVSLAHLEKMSTLYKDKILVVAGKVLSKGELSAPLHVAAYAYSETAKKKILAAKGKAMTLNEIVEQKVPASKMILVK